MKVSHRGEAGKLSHGVIRIEKSLDGVEKTVCAIRIILTFHIRTYDENT